MEFSSFYLTILKSLQENVIDITRWQEKIILLFEVQKVVSTRMRFTLTLIFLFLFLHKYESRARSTPGLRYSIRSAVSRAGNAERSTLVINRRQIIPNKQRKVLRAKEIDEYYHDISHPCLCRPCSPHDRLDSLRASDGRRITNNYPSSIPATFMT